MPSQGFDPAAPLTPQRVAHDTVRRLGERIPCSVAGVLLVRAGQGELILLRSRPVDDVFLQAMQRRLLHSYRLCVGPALTMPEIETTVFGAGVAGPCEAPRSLLTMPLLYNGRVIGVIGIASVFPGVFGGEHLCTMAGLAAQVSEVFARAPSTAGWDAPGRDGFDVSPSAVQETQDRDSVPTQGELFPSTDLVELSTEEPVPSRAWGSAPDPLYDRVSRYLESILDLTQDWQYRGEEGVSDLLRQDLEAISHNALRAHQLLAH